MKTLTEIDPILDAIDWDAPTGFPTEDRYYESTADKNPALYDFITTAAEIIPDEKDWHRFATALGQYEKLLGRP